MRKGAVICNGACGLLLVNTCQRTLTKTAMQHYLLLLPHLLHLLLLQGLLLLLPLLLWPCAAP
jgi:hypothetical protein